MKKTSAGSQRTKFIATASAFIWTIAIATSARGAQLQEARVTQVVNDVKLLLEQGAPRPAVVSDLIRRGNAVRTGTQSRSELTFADLTITRLGANTIFSFKEGTREMTLIDGAILFQVPKGSGGATIRTVGVTAAITGTTGIGEFHPATTSRPQPFSKWLCLEGTFHLYLPNGQSMELGPGKMVTTDGKSFSKVMTFDIKKLVSTSLFFTGFDQPLASMNLIMLESQNQLATSLLATTTTNPLDPTRIVNVTSQAIVAEEAQTSPTPSITPPPSPTPTKFGTPSTITSPNPYLITSGTVITTDPSITTNGVTDFGKIYRGQADDGAFSLWAFGSTSAFDTALRIDDIFFGDPNHLPIGVFKFQSLSLTGDPTIDTSNGVTKLALIGVDGITSGPPGGTLKFTGLDLLVLATVNGSINLTSDVSFQDLHELAMYARGAGSDLTINSPISNIGILGLVAQDSIHLTNPGTMSVGKLDAITGGDLMLQIGGSLLLNGRVRLDAIVLPGASVEGGINLTLNVTGDYTNNSATQFSHLAITNRDHIGGDASIAVGATNISTANNLDVQIANQAGGHIGENALVNVGVSGGDINIAGDASFQILNNDRGHIGGSANILVTTGAGGDLTADSIFAFINNRNGGSIDSGASLVFNLGGTLTTTGDATFGTSNRNDGRGGGTIGSLAIVGINAASISVGGFFQTFISTNGGGSIQGDAINAVNSSGDLTAQDGILLDITTTIFGGTGNFTGGHIGGNAIVALNAQNITTPSTNSGIPGTDLMAIEASIYPNASGTVGGDAIVDVSATQNISAPGSVLFWVANGNYQNLGAGMIGGNAEVNVTASNISTGDFFDQILNYGGASIGGHASIDLTADTLSVGGNLDSRIDNFSGGSINGSANLNFNLSGDLTAQGDAIFQIFNSGGGTIGSDATINVTAGNITANSFTAEINNSIGGTVGTGAAINVSANTISTTGALDATINNTGGSIGGNATIDLNAPGAINTAAAFNLLLANYDETGNPAGHIHAGANVSLSTGGDFTADFASIAINNRAGGMIDSGASLIVNIGGAFTTLHNGPDFFGNDESLSLGVSNRYANNAAGFIGGDATLLFHADSAFIGGNLAVYVSDRGGTIDGNALLNFNVTHDVTVTGAGDPMFFTAADIELLNDSGSNVGSPFGGTIHGDATLQVSATNFTLTDPVGSLFVAIDNRNGGIIDSNATLTFNLTGNLNTQGSAVFHILNDQNEFSNGMPGGSIGLAAALDISAANISVGTDFIARILNHRGQNAPGPGAGSIGTDATLGINAASLTAGGILEISIYNRDAGAGSGTGGSIGGNAAINLNIAGTLSSGGEGDFLILNESVVPGSPGGTIGGNAAINITAANIGDPTNHGDELFSISNSAGTIGGNAAVSINAANITANSLVAQIDNTGGSIGGNTEGGAMINMNVSNSATVTNDATVAIYGSDGAVGGAGININGGNYNVGGTFLSYVDGNGTITFNNASAHADVLKAGVFGANGALNISGGTLSADSILKLYAPGSNGQLNFMSNVTLGGNSLKILAANSVTIFDNIVVTIGGRIPADVYTNHANYTGFGGNGTTTGTFAGAGAHDPQPLSSAPPFGPVSRATVRTGGNGTRGKKIDSVIHVRNSDELLALLDRAAPGPGGKITIPPAKSTSNSRNSNRTDVADRSNAGSRVNADRRAMDMRTASSSVIRRSSQ